ncbi:uncharacterized protein LOC115592404 isoform X1 [Scomber scombrus]|uniref:Uncharacterized protein LOC115592404 isoform X1 n=1 Tax=Scomber scombrus TaxID=13677 RepID=A0AAV1NXZ1_SCOSC
MKSRKIESCVIHLECSKSKVKVWQVEEAMQERSLAGRLNWDGFILAIMNTDKTSGPPTTGSLGCIIATGGDTHTARWTDHWNHWNSCNPAIEKTCTSQKQDTTSSDHADFHPSISSLDNIFEVIDLTSVVPNDSQTEPQHIFHETFEDVPELQEADTVVWDSEDDLGTADDETVVITWNYVNNEDVTQSAELNGVPTQDLFPSSSANGLPTLHAQLIHEEEEQVAQQDSELNFSPEDQTFMNQLSQPASAGSIRNPVSPQRVSIHRIKVVEDLLAVFMDSNIINLTLKMDFVNEKAIDDAGVSREVSTAFWEQFLEQCEGETERVPRLRPDFCEAEWQAVGRIWAKGLLDHGVMPVRLSKAFILACIHGLHSVDVDILMTSFLTTLLLLRDQLLRKLSKLKLSDKESVLSLYESKKATGKRVSQLFETTKVVVSQREQATFNHLQRYVKNSDQSKAEQFLRFCTGASVICVDKIMVCFNAETGLKRRPGAHTYGATLEIPCTYSSYPEFRSEFDNILSSNYFEMDIL